MGAGKIAKKVQYLWFAEGICEGKKQTKNCKRSCKRTQRQCKRCKQKCKRYLITAFTLKCSSVKSFSTCKHSKR
jgi:hypothetical protein